MNLTDKERLERFDNEEYAIVVSETVALTPTDVRKMYQEFEDFKNKAKDPIKVKDIVANTVEGTTICVYDGLDNLKGQMVVNFKNGKPAHETDAGFADVENTPIDGIQSDNGVLIVYVF